MLQGRERERAAVAVLLADAAAGRGGALVLRGQPGVGKSALLADTVARAAGTTVLRTQGIESESPLAFAALQRLLRPVAACVDRLPHPQAQALRTAFGEAAGGEADRFLVFLGALNVLAEAAERAPVVAVVDDAHWLDEASAAALQFVARRLQNERVALLFGARTGDVGTFDTGDLPALDLGGVDAAAAGALLSDRAGVPVPAEVRDALLAGTGANPLALVELAEALTADQLSGAAPLPERLPLTQGVERAFLDRCRRLPDQAQSLLLVAAADDSGRAAVVRQAAHELGVGEDALEAAERSGLLRVEGAAVELRHPLVRSAVYGAATSSGRRRVHRALAAALRGPDDADRRAWHLAASVEEPDDDVVAALDAAAERAVARGGHEAASAAWERAAELITAGEERARRLCRAAHAAWLTAQQVRGRALADAGLALTTDPGLRAELRRLRAHLEFHGASQDEAHRMVLEAAAEVAPHDRRQAGDLAMLGAALAASGARSGSPVDPTGLLPPAGPDAPVRDRCLVALVRGLHAVPERDWPRSTPALRAAVGLADRLDGVGDEDLLINLGVAAWFLGDDDVALRLQDRLLRDARETGGLVTTVHALTRRNIPELATGRWAAAATGAGEALTLAENSGQPVLAAWPTAVLAVLAALRGETARAVEHLAAVEAITAGHALGIVSELVSDLARWARGLLDAADPAALLQPLERLTALPVTQLAAPDRIEAAVRAGRDGAAREWVAELASFAEGTGAAWAAALAAHGRAVLADGEEAEEHFRAALSAHEHSPRLPARARTQLAYGRFLRRNRRRVDARPQLRAALGTFEELGAAPWAELARQELRASGETARRRDAVETPALTPQELQVAALVRQGLSNRDAAARLFLSPRTVDFHLRNVFAKLGVASRTELAALPMD
ncbi:AAA family ATPase [Geodermatophilus sabuli]|uniref:Regulatory protein, luxR family n=1 Tax=Geodermatophilus sabuli TaxID=1564158 RepID=A0A285E7C5_9ACTN|nr:helix-turn-helix transcriptional regulator [Geodermatophilus sabuli]MBB3082220.1 DNA-binding CsgD family transcriptional regulator [Geodermatophilus sabuli]SNX94907.1 regulatory protein, luxR family [Geodermatophilus sabuli]